MEVWKDIKNYKGHYQASNLGRIRSLKFGRSKIMKQSKDKDGYLILTLHKKGVPSSLRVHRLVLKAFVPNPKNKPQVNHLYGIKTDNNVSNLSWATMQENIDHAIKLGLQDNRGVKNGQAKLNRIAVLLIRQWQSKLTPTELSQMFGVSKSTIHEIKSRRKWKHIDPLPTYSIDQNNQLSFN